MNNQRRKAIQNIIKRINTESATGPLEDLKSEQEYLDWDQEGGLADWIDGKVYQYMTASFPQ